MVRPSVGWREVLAKQDCQAMSATADNLILAEWLVVGGDTPTVSVSLGSICI